MRSVMGTDALVAFGSRELDNYEPILRVSYTGGTVLPAIYQLLLLSPNDCEGASTQIKDYWDDGGWSDIELAEDGDWNTAASAGTNWELFANHPYHGGGQRFWRAKYSSSGSQYTLFDCYDYDAAQWTTVWKRPLMPMAKP